MRIWSYISMLIRALKILNIIIIILQKQLSEYTKD